MEMDVGSIPPPAHSPARHVRDVTRRRFVRSVVGLGLSATGLALLGACEKGSSPSKSAGPDAPLETTRLLLMNAPPGICVAPYYVAAEELLRGEGFTDLQWVTQKSVVDGLTNISTGKVDIGVSFVAPTIVQVEAGQPLVLLGGIHVGCFELFGTEQVRAIRDLKGKSVAVPELGGGHHLFVSSMATYVGLDPRRDITWAVHPPDEAKQLLAEGKVDAYMAFPPDPQEMRAKRIGHPVVSSAVDRPWSQYFCCFAIARREFIRKNPVATKRFLRAFVKAADICAAEPERAARLIVDKGYTPNYENALQTLRELPYNKWREYDPEDTVRFYALRLQEAGLIKSSPKKIIAEATDWRFFNELKKELKT